MFALNLTLTAWLAMTAATVHDIQTTIPNLRGLCHEQTAIYGRHPSDARLWVSAAAQQAAIGLVARWLGHKPGKVGQMFRHGFVMGMVAGTVQHERAALGNMKIADACQGR